MHFTFVLCFTRIEATSGYHDWCWRMLWIKRLLYVFCTQWGDIRVPWLMSRKARNSTYILCFTCVEAISGCHGWCQGMVQVQCLYCVLHALRRCQGTMIDAEVCCKFNVCIIFYTHWGDIKVSWLMPRDAVSSTFVLCFKCIEATSTGHKSCWGII